MNPYKILNLKPGATDKEISKAYRSLALIYHPDKRKSSNTNHGNDEEMFQKAKEAYQMLIDPKRRAEIDLKLAGEEERKLREAKMSEHRKQLQRDLLEREQQVSNPEKTTKASTSAATTAKTSQQFNYQPRLPQFTLKLKVKTGTSPLPITPDTLSASIGIPAAQIHVFANEQVLAEFRGAHEAAQVLGKIPFDAVKSGDWFLGYPPAELFTFTESTKSTTPTATVKPKITKEFESDVLKRLREAAAAANASKEKKK